jgi:hypothetical protein
MPGLCVEVESNAPESRTFLLFLYGVRSSVVLERVGILIRLILYT